MFKVLYRNLNPFDKIKLYVLILFGAISEPLIAYSYILLGKKISNPENINSIGSLSSIVSIIIIALIIAGINYLGIDLVLNNIITSIRKKSFNKILNKNTSEIIKRERASYYNDVLKKIEVWKFRYLKSIIDIFELSLQIIFIIIFISIIDIRITLVIGIFLIPLIINNIFFPKKMEKGYKEYLKKDSEQLERMKEYLDAILIIKNNNEENEYSNKMDMVFDEVNLAWRKTSILSNLSAFIANSGVVLSRIAGILISLIFYIKGYISIGTFLALTQLTMFISEPIIKLINAIIGINSMKELNKYIISLYNDSQDDNLEPLNLNFHKFKIKGLNYQYTEGINVFSNDINIKFKKGGKYLIIGESGSGKSTLVKIFMKYYLDFIGEIEIDDISLRDIDEKTVNKNIFYIPQNIFIFNDSIRNNIDIKETFNDDEIKKSLEDMNLSHLIDNDKGLYSMIGQEINTLSGGEAARLYMVKAKLSNKNVIIADEILSNLDKKNSMNVESLLLSLDGRTVIHIAHNYNPEYYELYDEILKLG